MNTITKIDTETLREVARHTGELTDHQMFAPCQAHTLDGRVGFLFTRGFVTLADEVVGVLRTSDMAYVYEEDLGSLGVTSIQGLVGGEEELGYCEAWATAFGSGGMRVIHMRITEPFDVGLHLPDLSTAGALLAEVVLARPVVFPAGFSGSTGYARIAATAETVLDVQKNGSNIGVVTFAAASATPTFALPSPTSFAAGDRLGIVNEDPADATLAGVSLTFAGTRGS